MQPIMRIGRVTAPFQFDFRDTIVHIGFGMLFLMAYVFYAERMFADASYYLFHLVNQEWFYIEHDRLVLALSEILPWIGVKLGLSMNAVLHMFSVGHVLFFYFLFLVCRYVYLDKGAGLLLILLQTIGLEMGYFTPMFELYYGTGLLVLFASILWHQRFGAREQVLLFLTTLFILTSHPVAVLLWGFVLVLHAVDFGRQYLRWYGIFTGVFVLYLGYKFIASSSYEQTKTLAFIDTLRVMSYGTSYLLELIKFMLKYYIELLVLLVTWMVWMMTCQKYLSIALVLLGFAGMLVVINGAHYGFQHSRYQEQVYFPLSWIVAFPYALSLARRNMKPAVRLFLWGVPVILIIIKITAIMQESDFFVRRTAGMERQIAFVKTLNVQKAIIGEANVSRPTSAGPNWSYGIETLLLSAREGTEHNVTICLDSDMAFENNKDIAPDEFLFRKWDVYPVSWLNPEYFKLEESQYYPLMTKSISAISIDTFTTSVSLELPESKIRLSHSTLGTIEVVIRNQSGMPLPADTSQALFLSYHWVKDEAMLHWDGHRTPLELDIPSGYTQTMDILGPETTGEYVLIVDIVAEGQAWFGLDAKKTVWVR